MNPSNIATLVRGAGSDTTYHMMVALQNLYNNTPGCITAATGSPFVPDGSCADLQPGTPGLQHGPESTALGQNGNYDHDVIFNYYPVGSGNGITTLLQSTDGTNNVIGFVRFARSSRGPAGTDPAGLRFLAFARDAIPWIKYNNTTVANEPSDPVTDLPQADMQAVFTACTKTQWSQVNGGTSATPIIVWAAQAGSGTRASFDGFLGSGSNSTNCIPASHKDANPANGERVVFENQSISIFQSNALDCSGQPAPCTGDSIFYYSLGKFNEAPPVSGNVQGVLGSINGTPPTEPNVISGAFLFSRNVYNVLRHTAPAPTANASTRDFFDGDGFLCASTMPTDPRTGVNYRTEIENAIRGTGFIPLPAAPQGGGFPNGHCRITDT